MDNKQTLGRSIPSRHASWTPSIICCRGAKERPQHALGFQRSKVKGDPGHQFQARSTFLTPLSSCYLLLSPLQVLQGLGLLGLRAGELVRHTPLGEQSERGRCQLLVRAL